MDDQNNKPNLTSRLCAFLKRHWFFSHIMLMPVGFFLLFCLFKIPPFLTYLSPGPETALTEWLVNFTLIFARFFEVEIPASFPFALLITILMAFMLPQFLFWAYRRRKKGVILLVSLIISMDVAAVYSHSAYCVWSYKRALSSGGEAMPQVALYERCGYPLCRQRTSSNRLVTFYYTDGFMYASVDINDEGIASVHRLPLLLGDSVVE